MAVVVHTKPQEEDAKDIIVDGNMVTSVSLICLCKDWMTTKHISVFLFERQITL